MSWNAVKEFLRPTKLKILIALILPFVFDLVFNISITLYRAWIKATPPVYLPVYVHLFSLEFLTDLFIYFIIQPIFCYPTACSIATFYSYWKNERLNRKVLTYAFVVITFFNPITFSFLSAKIILSKAEPCGVLIGNIIPNSPAEQIGIEPRSTILYINGKPIYNVISLGKVMEKTKPGDILRLKLVAPNGSRYERTVVLTTSPKQFDVKGGFLGIANLTISIRPYCKFSG